MTAVTICSDFGAHKNLSLFPLFPHWFAMKWWTGCHGLHFFFWMLSLNQLFHALLSVSSRGSLVAHCFLPLEWYHLHIWGCWYFLHLDSSLCFIQLIFCMRYSAYKLNRQGDNTQPCTPFPIFKKPIVPCPVLLLLYSFLRRQVRWSGSVQFRCSVVSNSLWPHEPQHTRPPCPSPTPRVHPNPCPLNQWCRPTISSSVIPFSSCPQFFPASGSFQMSQLFASAGQSIGVSASVSVPSNEHRGLISFRMDWLDLLAVQGTLKSLLQHHS